MPEVCFAVERDDAGSHADDGDGGWDVEGVGVGVGRGGVDRARWMCWRDILDRPLASEAVPREEEEVSHATDAAS